MDTYSKAKAVFQALIEKPLLAKEVYEMLFKVYGCTTCEGQGVLPCDCPGTGRGGSPVCGMCQGSHCFLCPDCS